MKSKKRGKSTFKVEVQDISKRGVWLIARGKEYFLPFKQYPWFRKATPPEIYTVEMPQRQHLYWPALDVDLELESLDHPDNYPLVYQ